MQVGVIGVGEAPPGDGMPVSNGALNP